ncbi:MAG TPA: T9SS type A sorting domain-containing protein [Bacteroidia bacterium]|jgi:hypothetical protein|nr:T9SS type A sorting domain-containing protein [Bacteroidia bacterium]
MKTFLLPGLVCLLSVNVTFAQINITQADMPQAGDTIRVSTTTDTTGLPAPSYTGANITWNYAGLVAQSQNIDTFLSIASTPVAYQIFFNDPFLYPLYVSTVAQNAASPPKLGTLSITSVIDYYKDETNNYESVGYGATINSIPASVKDDYIDVVYNFPLTYGNADSCNSSSHINIASLGYYGQQQKRVNHVDGWGTLITPFGTFQTVRVKTILYSSDSLYIDTFHIGFATPQIEQIQYKWLGNGIHVPLLQINENVVANNPVYANTVYPDKIKKSLGIASIASSINNVELYPDPASENTTLNYTLAQNSDVNIAVFSADGRCVQNTFNGMQTAGIHQLEINTDQLSPGIYLVKIYGDGGQSVKRLTVVH